MSRKKYMLDLDGEIFRIFPTESAEIGFVLNGKAEKALLRKKAYYHNGRVIPDNESLSKYIRNNMQVKFSCHILEGSTYSWFTVICRASNDSPLTKTTVTTGISTFVGRIEKITKRHGVLAMTDNAGNERRVAFLASKVYLQGKRFPSSKMLNTKLCLEEKLVFDAVPCFAEDNKDNCEWFANCAYQGKRPHFMNPYDPFSNNAQAEMSYKSYIDVSNNDCISNQRLNLFQQNPTHLKSQLLKCINVHANNPRNVFTTGSGFILDILNDEFGIILGCFRNNVFQTILFHRKSAYLFKVPLVRAKLSEIFVEGDRMKFIAVGAPTNFYTDWIAIQVSVSSSLNKAETDLPT